MKSSDHLPNPSQVCHCRAWPSVSEDPKLFAQRAQRDGGRARAPSLGFMQLLENFVEIQSCDPAESLAKREEFPTCYLLF